MEEILLQTLYICEKCVIFVENIFCLFSKIERPNLLFQNFSPILKYGKRKLLLRLAFLTNHKQHPFKR